MKKPILWIIFVLTAALARAESMPGEATVVASRGAVSIDGKSDASRVGAKLASGSHIVSGSAAEVTLRLFDGTLAIVESDSDLTIEKLSVAVEAGKTAKETTVLSLQKGSVVASLDPAKKDVNDFRVKTPNGVAIARGTVFAVRVSQTQNNATVSTMSGTVTFVTDRGEFTVGFGQVATNSGVMTVKEAVAADPTLAAMFVEAAGDVAAAIGSGAITGASRINTVLAAVVEIAAEASPNQAAAIAVSVLTAVAPALDQKATTTATVIGKAAMIGAARGDPGLESSAKSEVIEGIVTAAQSPSLQIPPGVVRNALQGDTPAGGRAFAEANTILPPLDQTQVVVSPSR